MKNHKDLPADPIQVRCYSGHKADERPVSFRIGGAERTVEDIIDQWCGEDHTYFKVLTDDHKVYLLRLDREADSWSLVDVKERIGRH